MKKLFKIEDILSHIPKRQIENEVWANPSRDWVILLFSFFILFALVFGYSMYRFYVWQNIEEYLPDSKSEEVEYKKGKAQKVLGDFEERRNTTTGVTIPNNNKENIESEE